MKQRRKFRPNYLFTGIILLAMLCTLTWKNVLAHVPAGNFYVPLTAQTDTTKIPDQPDSLHKKIKTDTIPGKDSFATKQKIDTFSVKLSKDSLDAPVKYKAKDSAVVLIQDKKIILYGNTQTDYKDISLTAPEVHIDQQSQLLTAVNRKDSEGVVLEPAHFKDGQNEFSSDTIRYNFKTQSGLTYNTTTQQSGMFLQGEVAKKVNENTTFIRKARFTTCDLDEPHFAFVTNKMKVINGKIAVSGPTHPEFEGVPIPIAIPFGIYPLSQHRHSGFLPPQFTTNEQYGVGLEGIGYYKTFGDYWDARVYGNIYSYGGWSLNVNPTYRKRYHYNGAFNFSMISTKINFKGDPDYSKLNTFNITWNHSVDSKARPGTTFSANVNAGSTKYNQYVPNSPQVNFQNQLGSSITYSKAWKDKPYYLTLSANHNQNNFTHLINVSLPDAGFTVNTIYPFQKKNQVSAPKWWQKLGVGYNGSLRNEVSFYDTAFQFKRLLDTLQWGAQHNFPLTITLPPFFGGAIIAAPSISYSQTWIAEKFRRSWDDVAKKVDTTITKGLFVDQQVSFGFGLNTALYGRYNFKNPNSRIMAIRHVIRPSIGLSYRPDLSKQHFYSTHLDTSSYVYRFSEFERSLYGYYSEGRFGGMTFQVDNNLEMKLRPKKNGEDSASGEPKHVPLIDGYGFSSGYNFFADSMKLSPFQLYLRSTLFEKINLSAAATLDPYQVNERGQDISKYAWQGGKFSLGRLTTGNISLSTNFKSKPKDPKKEEERQRQIRQRLNDPTSIDEQQRLLDYMQQNPSQFVDFNIQWQFSLSYSLVFYQQLKQDLSGFTNKFTSNVNFNGSFNLTPKWNFTTNGYYDFNTKKLQTFQMSISRDMHCWQMSINVTPIGLYRYFSFTINPKSSILQDLRINRSRFFSNY